MAKEVAFPAKPFQIYLPEKLPFEGGTDLSNRDPCSRLLFQLLVERLLPGHSFDLGWVEELVFNPKEGAPFI